MRRRGFVMFKRAVALVVTAAMALGLAACNTETTEATASIYTKVTESMMSLNEDGVKAVNAYKELIKVNKDSIQIIEKYFSVPTCGLYDINSDGIPEFYFFAATDSTGYSATFFVFTYDKGSDAAVKKIEIPNIMYLSGGDGEYAVFTSPVALLITRSTGGSESVTETIVYDMNFYKNGSYKLTQVHDASTERIVNKYYANGSPADQTAYDQLVTVHIDQATMVLATNMKSKSEEEDSPLLSKPSAKIMNYESMLSYLIKLS
jgi:hypothetical protein